MKLHKAIRFFNLDITEKTLLDIGSSTEGFTGCALQHGAKKVIAVDIGKEIMYKDWWMIRELTCMKRMTSEIYHQE